MKVLWFEVSVPGRYLGNGAIIGGWQDSLEDIVRELPEIELYIAFEGKKGDRSKKVGSVTYIPIVPVYSKIKDKIFEKLDYWSLNRDKMIPLAISIINDVNPDIIHVFGSEWCWGQVAKYVSQPVVIHMQGSIPPYQNAFYPPGYNLKDYFSFNGIHLNRSWNQYWLSINNAHRAEIEEETLKIVSNYMGRTMWDRNIVKLYNPTADYYYCSEALRPAVLKSQNKWSFNHKSKLRLVTVGCTSLLKGIDTILRTAKILKKHNVDFEWFLVGKLWIKDFMQYKENIRFEDVNVKLTGFLDAEALVELLLSSTIYVHTAYIDNSPNSICEAQYLGVPVISTFVGGIPSLVKNGEDGILVPANDPYTLSSMIMSLYGDREKMQEFSISAMEKAKKRHSTSQITQDLLTCYKSIISKTKNASKNI